ncbi:MAG: hypothetical protein K8W52_41215 [Deltaproteobacteria bacterium]|nr:hypothetical protein [Deltaproteobacteria bacterium]
MTSSFPIAVHVLIRCASCDASLRFGGIVPVATCPGCRRGYEMSPVVWRNLLESPVLDGPDVPVGKTQLLDGEPYYLQFGRTPVECQACKQPVDDDVIAAGLARGAVACGRCRAPIAARQVPPELAAVLPGITHLLGEDLRRLEPRAPAAVQGIVVTCPQCAAVVAVDGSTRAVPCGHCAATVVIPGEVWARIRPASSDSHTFYLWHDPARRQRGVPRAAYSWGSLHDLATDPDGNIYLLTEARAGGMSDLLAVVALDLQLRTRWVRLGVPGTDDSRLAVSREAVVVWSDRGAFATRLAAADGADLGTIGGKQPDGATSHSLDLRQCKALVIDHDGSYLFVKHRRLVRCAPDGSGVATWPERKGFLGRAVREKLRPFGDDDAEGAPMADALKDYPTLLYGDHLAIGRDGRLYIQDCDRIVCFDRTGKRVYATELPRNNDWGADADARGQAYVPRGLARDTYALWRVSPEGQAAVFVDGRRPETPIREERHLAVAPDGTAYLFGSFDVVRVFAPDGSPRYLSPDAIKADADHARHAAERRARGEDE